MQLPGKFIENMRAILGPELPGFLACCERPPYAGVRLNPLKATEDVLRASLPFPLDPAPFSPFMFYAPIGWRPGDLAAHHAGMFYSQEPSAASAVTALDPQPGERVLDLCAAPGGKSTQIAGALGGSGLLWSNEVVRGRADVLLSNLERLGVRNAVVSSCHPQRLCEGLAGWFHRVLVDAPCSGEGMFRRDPSAIAQWTPESPAACAQRQRGILDSACLAVKEGGVLVYSTCTFSREENEAVCQAFLASHPEFQPEIIPAAFGRPALDGGPARRIFPMDGGEGHFVARFRRVGANPPKRKPFAYPAVPQEAARLYEELFVDGIPGFMGQFGPRVLLLPPGLPELAGLGVLRAGVELAQVKGRRLAPCHGGFVSHRREDCLKAIDFPPDAPELAAFFHGEEIACPHSGYTAVCVSGVVAGFGKASQGRLKNHYPKGLRRQRPAAPVS